MNLEDVTAQKMKFSIKDFFSNCHQVLWIWSNLLEKSLMKNFIFCAFIYFILFRKEHFIIIYVMVINAKIVGWKWIPVVRTLLTTVMSALFSISWSIFRVQALSCAIIDQIALFIMSSWYYLLPPAPPSIVQEKMRISEV